MKHILFLLAISLQISCATSMSSDKFFCSVSTKDIPDVRESSILYKHINYFADSIICGTVAEPLFDFNIKFDTLSRYKVTVVGDIIFKQMNYSLGQYRCVDSVRITRLIIDRLNCQREFYSNLAIRNKYDEQIAYKKWQECTLPKRILKRIRNDFLKRKKYVKYTINENEARGVTVLYSYRLY